MPALKIALQLSDLRLPFRKSLEAAARMGVTGVEIDARGQFRPQEMTQTALRELRRLLDEYDLRTVAVGFHTRRGYDTADELDRRVAATKAAMQFAGNLRAPLVINHVGHVPSESSGSAWDLLVQSLTDLSQYGQHVGARLAAQTGTENGADLLRLLDALPQQGIAVDFDPGNLIINGFSPLETVRALGSNIAMVHARDAVRDLARGRGLEVTLGRGSADFPALLGALEESSYRGYLTVARAESSEPQAEMALAVKYLGNL